MKDDAAPARHHEEAFEHKEEEDYQNSSVFISAPATAATPAMLVLVDSNATTAASTLRCDVSAKEDGNSDSDDERALVPPTLQISRERDDGGDDDDDGGGGGDASPPVQFKSLTKSSKSATSSSSWASLKSLLQKPEVELHIRDRLDTRRLSLQELRQRTSQLALTVQAAVARRMSLQSQIASTRFRAVHEHACSSSSRETNKDEDSSSARETGRLQNTRTVHEDDETSDFHDGDEGQRSGEKGASSAKGNEGRSRDFFRRSLADLEKLERTYTTEFIASEHAQKELQAHGLRLAEVKQELQQSQVGFAQSVLKAEGGSFAKRSASEVGLQGHLIDVVWLLCAGSAKAPSLSCR